MLRIVFVRIRIVFVKDSFVLRIDFVLRIVFVKGSFVLRIVLC